MGKRAKWAPAQQRTAKGGALRPGHERASPLKHLEFINLPETILSDQ
jgi:hypothetical protein